jgi:hypothetical protein
MNVPEYEHLREAERKLDWTMARHVMELQDSLGKTMQARFDRLQSCNAPP